MDQVVGWGVPWGSPGAPWAAAVALWGSLSGALGPDLDLQALFSHATSQVTLIRSLSLVQNLQDVHQVGHSS